MFERINGLQTAREQLFTLNNYINYIINDRIMIFKNTQSYLCRKLRRRPSGRFALLIIICFFWLLYVISVQLEFESKQTDEEYLREKIVKLSKEYVRIIEKDKKKEMHLGISWEPNGFKQTTIILLQNMIERIQVLEKQVDNMVSQSTEQRFQLTQQIKDLSFNINMKYYNMSHVTNQSGCNVPNDPLYPECASKVEWLRIFWKRDIKYSNNGVDGSVCSFLVYLSEVEHFCPGSKKLFNSDCEIPKNNHDFPQCKNKISWMLQHWKENKRFSSHGVDGSLCSILSFLSTIESWCPLLAHATSSPDKNDCKVPQDKDYPNCKDKVDWMMSHWKSHPCYAQEYNVNGSVCSFLHYLSKVENWCPKNQDKLPDIAEEYKKVDLKRTSKGVLIDKLSRVISAAHLSWIRQRINRLYMHWVAALDNLQTRLNVSENKCKKIIVHIGVLGEEKFLHFAETAGNGGPLGELVQWSDVITSLYILGHNIQVTVEHKEFLRAIQVNGEQACPPRGSLNFDLIFTDYYGLNYLKKKARSSVGFYSCRLRIIDSFGTEAQFNYNGAQPRFAAPPGITIKRNLLSANNLNLKQYMTMFPHSPDNSFLGFVVDSQMNIPKSLKKKPKALAYGKHYNMWKDLKTRGFLDVIHEHFEIHATTGGMDLASVQTYLPNYVINHGVLGSDKLQELLRESKLFIGLGSPYEGPAPLEAIAQGCVFLNPKFNPPKNQINTKFFKGKPTFRSLTSQHPYAEIFIGEPYVYTVDIQNTSAVKIAVKKIIDNQPSPYLPFEYTNEGMLERVNAFVKNQDFCKPNLDWPPVTSRKVFTAKLGESCQHVCLEKGFVCEPAFFPTINNGDSLKKTTFPCDTDKIITRPSLVAPAYVGEDKACVLQGDRALYSCTASHYSVRRICPCRDYRNGQVALCKTCY